MTQRLLPAAIGFLLMMVPGVARGQAAPNVPVLASGQLPPATPGADVEVANMVEGSIQVGANYDDNAVLGAAPRQWDIDYNISPSITFRETLPRFDWSLKYGPGFTKSQNLTYRSQVTQNFGGQFTWRTSKHSQLSVQQSYIRSTNPFDQSYTQPGPTLGTNNTIYVPSLRRTTILSNGEFSYQLSEHTNMGFGGSFNHEGYQSTPQSGQTTSLVYSQNVTGNGYISHQLSARNQLGFQYVGQVLRFPIANARTTTHSFLVSEQLNFSPHSVLSLYAGPEYSQTFNQVVVNLGFIIITIPVNANQWNASGGVIYNWTGQRVAVALNYSRGISDGGGLVGAVSLNTGTATATWRLTERWNLITSLAGGDDQLLAVKTGQNEMLTYSASAALTRQLSRNLTMNFNYERLNETGSLGNLPIGNHDLVYGSVTYSFMKPLGR